MLPLHVPSSIRCPPVDNPLRVARTPVPYADALESVRASRQLHTVVAGAFDSDDDREFLWLDQENSSNCMARCNGKARKSQETKEATLRFNFMYFRIRTADYRAILGSLIKSTSPYSEDSLRRWTHSYRFRLRKGCPLKNAVTAFAARMGLESDQNVVYCQDGFYGDPTAGTLSCPTGIPHLMLQTDIAAQACGLGNGSSIFVSRTTPQERRTAAVVLSFVNDLNVDEPEEAQAQATASQESSDEVV